MTINPSCPYICPILPHAAGLIFSQHYIGMMGVSGRVFWVEKMVGLVIFTLKRAQTPIYPTFAPFRPAQGLFFRCANCNIVIILVRYCWWCLLTPQSSILLYRRLRPVYWPIRAVYWRLRPVYWSHRGHSSLLTPQSSPMTHQRGLIYCSEEPIYCSEGSIDCSEGSIERRDV